MHNQPDRPDDAGLQAPQRSLRDAMVTVPREPTAAMVTAGRAEIKPDHLPADDGDASGCWRAMIAAYEASVSPYLRRPSRSETEAALDTAVAKIQWAIDRVDVDGGMTEPEHKATVDGLRAALNRIRALVPDKAGAA
jgi:hypothetical protein